MVRFKPIRLRKERENKGILILVGLTVLIIMGILILFNVSEIRPSVVLNTKEQVAPSCGDNVCSLDEDCNTCLKDCSCKKEEFCSEEGICRQKDVCGDEICSDNERLNNLCCEDCKCTEDLVCNKVLQLCQPKIIVSEDTITNVVNQYLSENNIEGKILKIIDTYYKEQMIKEVIIDCSREEVPYPCEITLFINEKGEILEEMRTS